MFLNKGSFHIESKGWGHEEWIVNTSEYCGKRFLLEKGKRCSWHYHRVKDETILVMSGLVKFELGDSNDLELAQVLVAGPGDAVRLFPGVRHRFTGLENSELVEFSTHHDELDSIRVVPGD